MLRQILVLILLSTLLLAGCECIGGFGRDLQKAGSWLEHRSGT
jgi:predicted small secreted protein